MKRMLLIVCAFDDTSSFGLYATAMSTSSLADNILNYSASSIQTYESNGLDMMVLTLIRALAVMGLMDCEVFFRYFLKMKDWGR
jgi:hypothetical protein